MLTADSDKLIAYSISRAEVDKVKPSVSIVIHQGEKVISVLDKK